MRQGDNSRRAFNASRNVLAGSILMALVSGHAAAAPADPRRDAQTLDAVEVTANPLRGRTEELSEPTELLTGEKLDEAKAATLGETVDSLPGVQSSNFGPGVGRPIIRGLDGARVAVLSGGLATQDVSTVSQDHAPAVEPFLADQIEVLKGPATLLYGSGAIGGVVNIVDGRIPERAGSTPFSGRAEARYDSVNDGHTEMLRIDGGDESFGLHADFVNRDNGDYDTPDGVQANSYLETQSGAVGASLLGAWGFFGMSAARFEDRYGNPGEPGDAAAGEPGVFLDIEQNRYEAKGAINAPFNGFSALRFSLANTDYEHTEFEGEEVGTLFVKDATEGRFELVHEDIGGWVGAVGLQLTDAEFEAIGEEAFVPRTKTRSSGLFVLERAQWDGLQMDVGARIDRVNTDPDGAPERSFSPFSASLGLIWTLDERWDLRANLDRAQRAPAEEELFSNGPHVATAAFEIGDANLREETANQVELGLHFHSERVNAKASAYYNRFDDFIYLVDTGLVEDDLPVRQWTQADARFRGFEGEVTFLLAEGEGGKWEWRSFADTVRGTLTDGGGNLPRIVPARFGSDLRWERDQWRASLSFVRNAEQDRVAQNETQTDGYTLVDAHLAYHFDVNNIGWELFLDGRNLTDARARVHTSFIKDTVELPGRGASIGVRAFF